MLHRFYSLCSFLILTAFVLYSCQGQNNTNVGTSITPSELQQKTIHSHVDGLPIGTQLSIAFVNKDSVEYCGIKVAQDSILFVNNQQAIFEIGSITKVFTATLLAQMVEKGHMQLNDPINPYLPVELNNKVNITFKQLSNHSSGLPRLPSNLVINNSNAHNPYAGYSEAKLLDYIQNDMQLTTTPGTTHLYSNIGVGLLGYVLAQIDGNTYENMLQDKLLQPLGMAHSSTDRSKVAKQLVVGIDGLGNAVSNWDLASLKGAGAMLSNTEDLSQFMLAQFDTNQTAMAMTRQKTLTINKISDFGLGWEIINRRSGATWYKHNGGTGGYTAAMVLDVHHKNGVVILSNLSALSRKSEAIDELVYALMKSIQQQP